MNKTIIRTLTNEAVNYIAKAVGCEATKAELTKQFKDKAEAMDKAYTAYKLIAKAEAEARKQKKAEAEKQKQEAIAKAEAKQKQAKQKQAKQKQDSKKDKQKQKQKDSKAEKPEKISNKPEVIELANKLDLTIRETEADNKKSRVFLVDTKAVAQIVYSKSGKGFQIKSNTAFAGAEYHAGWANKYAKRVATIAEVETIIADILAIKAEAKKQKETKKEVEKNGK